MELIFLGFLVFLMILFLASGFPVAFTLPGSAILSILAAAFFGYVIEGDASAYFIQDGPIQWLNAGVTNFRSLYWDVEMTLNSEGSEKSPVKFLYSELLELFAISAAFES